MSPALAEQVVKEGGDRLGGVHLTVSTLFADIRNFTPMSEGMDAAEVVGMLNEYFSYMVCNLPLSTSSPSPSIQILILVRLVLCLTKVVFWINILVTL